MSYTILIVFSILILYALYNIIRQDKDDDNYNHYEIKT